ncbi:MAG: hypothetical protein IJS58_03290 [Bacilli bacterium]|nr:hypothetical protein [Bacilli bacterium]
MIRKIQKYLITIAIVLVAACVLLAILALFIDEFFEIANNLFLQILLSFAVICVGCFFTNSALDVMDKTKILAITSVSLLCLSVVIALLLFWIFPGFNNVPEWFGKMTGIVALFSVYFTIVISTNAKFAGHYKALKIVYFALFGVVIAIILLEIFGVRIVQHITYPFIILCLVVFALMCICPILGKRVRYAIEENIIKIDKAEFDKIKERVSELEEENKKLKAELSKYEKLNKVDEDLNKLDGEIA